LRAAAHATTIAARMPSPARTLRRLARIFQSYGTGSGAEKTSALRELERASLPTARALRELHDILCFLRAYPDDAALLAQVEAMLAAFDRRRDLRRHRAELAGSGIAGTMLEFNFFAATARRLARSWPDNLTIDWSSLEEERLARILPLVALPAERAAFDEPLLRPRAWLRRFTGRGTDAALLLRGWDALEMDGLARDAFYDELDPVLRLAPGPDTPARTREKHPGLRITYQTRPLAKERPDLKRELREPPRSVREVSLVEGRALVELAQNTMLPRERDLEVFAYGNAADVRLIDAGDGLAFACIGVLPERRSLLEAVYAFLMLKNGVAVGYALCSALFGSSEVAYNVFETFRGGESARIFGRLLATIHHLFGSDTFAIDPYQLGGQGNSEGLKSGAFWFYQKLGFRPRRPDIVAVMDAELAKMARRRHRSSIATLKVLSSTYVLWHAGRARSDVLGILELPKVALHVSRYVAERFGADRERARRTCAREVAGVLGGTLRGWSAAERDAFQRWAPLVASLPGIGAWSRADKRALLVVIEAKGGNRESDALPPLQRHRALRQVIAKIARP
jgi:hypothetical protein